MVPEAMADLRSLGARRHHCQRLQGHSARGIVTSDPTQPRNRRLLLPARLLITQVLQNNLDLGYYIFAGDMTATSGSYHSDSRI